MQQATGDKLIETMWALVILVTFSFYAELIYSMFSRATDWMILFFPGLIASIIVTLLLQLLIAIIFNI